MTADSQKFNYDCLSAQGALAFSDLWKYSKVLSRNQVGASLQIYSTINNNFNQPTSTSRL